MKPHFIKSISDSEGNVLWQNDFHQPDERALSERSGLLMGAMLQKAIREGTGASVHSVYGVRIPLAGKTGTSQNYADAWFAAFNPGLVIVSRVGASTPAVHFNSGRYGSGSALALPLVAMTLKTFFDRLIDLFDDDEILYEEAGKRRRSILERIFRR